ncbi:hypothetical protein [Ruegeria sp. THAF33]|uniref:hypothetical protein n=1 Tax=Ruegeria sp. THAF33 TaxID=2587853 RepID=UPI001268F91E|nr:hypothetical protein [Ruegeria sp. THAF33]QFT72417.1 hypothetical protein FIU92_05210 [Ruegeria sp. THAF33]
MKLLPVLPLILVFAGCSDFTELEGSEPASVKSAPYPRLVPVQETLGPSIDPVSQAAEVEEDLTQRSEALAKKAQALQNAQTN